MKENQAEELLQLEEPHMTESEKINLRLKKFCFVIGIMLILWIIFLIIVLVNTESPNQDNNISQDESYNKAEEFISKLTLSEKIALLNCTNNIKSINKNETEKKTICEGQIGPLNTSKVNFKGMCLQNGPDGIHFAKGTGISWQAPINTAATFNKELMYKIGKTQGEESKEKGINTFLSPYVNIMRTPQDDKIWEGFGEDPFYSGICASEIIRGIQDSGVISTIKDFVGINQDTKNSYNIDTNVLMDIYVEPFYRAIHDVKVGAVMANNIILNNNNLLNDILRGILDFQGFVISNSSNLVDSFNSGVDLDLTGGTFDENNKYDNNETDLEKRVNESLKRYIYTMYKMNQMENYPKVDLYKETKNDERKNLTRKAATESLVLLKNDGILPLKNINKIVVIGNDAIKGDCGTEEECSNETNLKVNGNISSGYGSGTNKLGYSITPLQGIEELAKNNNINVIYLGNLIKKNGDLEQNSLDADVVIVFVKAISGEEYSVEVEVNKGNKKEYLLYGANELIDKIRKANKNVIVVIKALSAVILPWLDKVRAVLFSGFPGAEAGHAIADILFGKVNPSGHLPFTWPKLHQHFTNLNNCEEGLYVGQRWFNKYDQEYIFPFGFGLSYSSFNYSDLKLSMSKEGLTAEFNVTNESPIIGQAVPMMFLTFPKSIGDYIFKGFEKVEIEPNKTKKVTIFADAHALSYFNSTQNKYVRVNESEILVYIAENGNISKTKLEGTINAKY